MNYFKCLFLILFVFIIIFVLIIYNKYPFKSDHSDQNEIARLESPPSEILPVELGAEKPADGSDKKDPVKELQDETQGFAGQEQEIPDLTAMPDSIKNFDNILNMSLPFNEYFRLAEQSFEHIENSYESGLVSRQELIDYAKHLDNLGGIRNQSAAVILLKMIGDIESLETLREIFNKSQDENIRRFVLENVITFPIPDDESGAVLFVNAANSNDSEFNRSLKVALLNHGGFAVVEWVHEKIKQSKSYQEKEEAILYLSRIRGERSIEPIMSLVSDTEDNKLIQAAYNAIGAIGTPKSLEVLLSQVHYQDEDQNNMIANAISQIREPQTWTLVQDEFLLGSDLQRRRVALKGFAEGYSAFYKSGTIEVLDKIVSQPEGMFPEELLQDADIYLNRLKNI
jgi:hypothetical protein